MSERVAALIAGAGLCASSAAQTPSFVYSFHLANPNLNPGETTTVTVLCGFTPGIGGLVMTPLGLRPVVGLASGRFDLSGSDGAWTLGAPPAGSLLFPYNFAGTTHGAPVGGNVTGVLWSNGAPPPWGSVSTVNPTPLWRATFSAPLAPGPVVLTLQPQGAHGVWTTDQLEATSAAVAGAQAIINIIPAPASAASFGLFAVARRRRGRS